MSAAIDAETSSITKEDAVTIEELRATAACVATDLVDEQSVVADTEEVGLIGDPANEIVEYAQKHDVQ